MKYSEKALSMLEEAISGKLEDFWDFSFDFNALLGEDEEFAEGWDKENPEMFDLFCDYEFFMFLEEHDTNDTQGFIEFLKPYYEKAKQANEISELRSTVKRNAQATNSRFDKIEKQVANSNTKKPFWKR